MVSFDFADGVFEAIELPNAGIVGTGYEQWNKIVVLNESIALISFPLEVNDKCFEVWLMNGYFDGGGQISWTKYMTVEMPRSNMSPLRLLANGDVLLQDDKMQLNLYSPATGVVKSRGIEYDGLHELVIYNESLASFKTCFSME